MIIRKLKADEIECRIAQVTAKGCSLLLYKTARVDRSILDELFGDLWQNDFKVIDGKMYGGIGIYNKELEQWLWRWDCGVESNTEAEKGQASDCFKRAGFKWGIGVELYSAPFIWLNIETEKNKEGKYKLTNKFAKFSVKSITYLENGNIDKLTIVDEKGVQIWPKTINKTDENLDVKIFETLAACSKVEDVNLVWTKYNKQVKDRETFLNLCKKRKGAILATQGENNE